MDKYLEWIFVNAYVYMDKLIGRGQLEVVRLLLNWNVKLDVKLDLNNKFYNMFLIYT